MKTTYRNLALECQILKFVSLKPMSATCLDPEWFSSIPLQYICKAIKKAGVVLTQSAIYQLVKKESDLDDSVLPTVKQFLAKIDSAEDVSGEESFRFMVAQIAELYETRLFTTDLESVVDSLKEGDLSIAEIKEKTKEIAKKTVNKETSEKSGDWIGDYKQRIDVMEQKKNNDVGDVNNNKGIPTGVLHFDQMIGGLMKGEFGVIAGKPGIGKTAAMIDFSANAYVSGFNVLFCTGEMPKYDIQTRFDAHFAGIPSAKYRTGDLSQEERKRWRQTMQQYSLTQKNFLHVTAFPRMFNASQIEAEIIKVQDTWADLLGEESFNSHVHLIVVDYLNIMSPNKMGKSSSSRDWNAQADVVWDLKEVVSSINGGIACWTGGQILDEAYDKPRLELMDVKYARAISETAPVVVGLVQTKDDEIEDRLQFQVLKMRNAPKPEKVIYLHPNLSLMRLHERVTSKKDLLELPDSSGEYQKPKHNTYRKTSRD